MACMSLRQARSVFASHASPQRLKFTTRGLLSLYGTPTCERKARASSGAEWSLNETQSLTSTSNAGCPTGTLAHRGWRRRGRATSTIGPTSDPRCMSTWLQGARRGSVGLPNGSGLSAGLESGVMRMCSHGVEAGSVMVRKGAMSRIALLRVLYCPFAAAAAAGAVPVRWCKVFAAPRVQLWLLSAKRQSTYMAESDCLLLVVTRRIATCDGGSLGALGRRVESGLAL
jgi:hypothetical protein